MRRAHWRRGLGARSAPAVDSTHGRIFKVTGDGVLVEFASAVNAVECAVDLQRGMAEANAGVRGRHIVLRIGINLGDVIVEGGDLYGEGVNIAARLEAIAEPVRVYRYAWSGVTIPRPALALPDKPSIAVLPFPNMSGDPEQEYFSDGITEDIITELSRFRSLFVIARNSSFAFRGERIDIAEIARRAGRRNTSWRAASAGPAIGSASPPSSSTRRAARICGPSATTGSWRTSSPSRTRSCKPSWRRWPGAWKWPAPKSPNASRPRASSPTIRPARPGAAEPRGGGAQCRSPPPVREGDRAGPAIRGRPRLSSLGDLRSMDQRPRPGSSICALATARQALALDENDSRCHRILSSIYAHLRQHRPCRIPSDEASPSIPTTRSPRYDRARLLRYLGRAEEGIEWARKAMRLNPYHPTGTGTALLACCTPRGATRRHWMPTAGSPIAPPSYHAYVAACHAELGQMEEARAQPPWRSKRDPTSPVGPGARACPSRTRPTCSVSSTAAQGGLPE